MIRGSNGFSGRRQLAAVPLLGCYSPQTLKVPQLSLADNPVCAEYNEGLFDGLRKAGMQEN
jgi:hypothetical protein